MLKQFFLLALLALSFAVSAQGNTTEDEAREDLDYYSSREDRLDDNGSLAGQLWYGAGAQLAFQGGNFSSFFQVGLSPIVGYKLNNIISVGPRGSFAYNSFRQDLGGGIDLKENFITWQAGAFGRAKIFGQFFAHVEYSLVNERQRNLQTGELDGITRAIPFAGGGLSQGGGIGATGFEFLVLFRLSGNDRIGDSPFEVRTGINYNF